MSTKPPALVGPTSSRLTIQLSEQEKMRVDYFAVRVENVSLKKDKLLMELEACSRIEQDLVQERHQLLTELAQHFDLEPGTVRIEGAAHAISGEPVLHAPASNGVMAPVLPVQDPSIQVGK